ncbi:SOS response-associated peptidase [Paenisporosarcina sp. OV554]|uniref:SOS response-associated peptidase n=1 Tax=Paenisporosarcina sp. OV554 TaxID=2135694 RepID=UPI000D3735C9|nr:SOS response-associated peptidase [Paenisporosarcina sp. OV554]PUB16708.1 putative SOS response-associated peptidase YedK [Paenisporosarcina sp. OV554]
MCGRYSLFADFREIEERFGEATFEEDEYEESYNIAPSQMVLSVINDGVKNRLGYLKWGLVPSWAKDSKVGFKMINARAETVHEKPSFREAFKKKRCLIVADSFYEWKRTEDQKVPMRIKMKNNELFAMAGLWESWKSPSGELVHTCTILTTEPNDLMSTIHDRMPVILKQADEQSWLNPAVKTIDDLKPFLIPLENGLLEAYEVSDKVNSPKNNDSDLIVKVGE